MNTVRETTAEDQARFIDWVWQARAVNCFDADVMRYPRTVLLCAENREGPLVYVPLQSVLMFDALAPRPGISPREEALALARIGELVDQLGQDSLHRETYFLCRDDRVADICRRHGFDELVNYRILRRKIPPKCIDDHLGERPCG